MAGSEVGAFFAEVERDIEERRREGRARVQALDEAIGARLRRARGDVSRRVVVQTLADRGLPLQGSTLADIEAGRRGVRLSEAVVLAELYGVDLASFTQDSADDEALQRARLRRDEIARMREYLDQREANLLDELGEE